MASRSADVGLNRRLAVTMVSGLYLANLLGRVLASRLAHRFRAELLLAGALIVVLLGLPILLTAQNAYTAEVGLAIAGVCGPLVVAVLAQVSNLRVGLIALVGFTLLAAGALRWQVYRTS